MVYLVLSILSSSVIFVVFKLFVRYRVETFYAIVVNYLVAGTVAMALYEGEASIKGIVESSWFAGTVCLGVLFIVVFNLMAATSQRLGVSVASVATKMSLAIPVMFGVLVYKEELGLLKIIGILLALAAVYFTSIKKRSGKKVAVAAQSGALISPVNPSGSKLTYIGRRNVEVPPSTSVLLPLLVFLGSGIIDTSIKYAQEYHIDEVDYPLFSATVFAAAATTGVLMVVIKSLKGSFRFNFRNVMGGIALGVPNYFSIYLSGYSVPPFVSQEMPKAIRPIVSNQKVIELLLLEKKMVLIIFNNPALVPILLLKPVFRFCKYRLQINSSP